MALLDYVDPDTAVAETGGDGSDVSLFRAIMLNNPEVFERRVAYSGWLRHEGAIDPELKELAHVVTDRTNECAYCTQSHARNLIEVYGLEEERVAAVENREFDAFDERERAVMAFAEQVADDPKRVTEDHVAALRDVGFSDAEIVELLAHVAAAISANAMMDALNVHPADQELFE